MARGSRISVLGLYQYNSELFSGLVLPSDLDRDVFIDNLLMEYAELEVIYPDAEFMQDAIGRWSQMRLHAWEKMERVLYEDYDPFINIKRDEVRTITQERDLQDTGTLRNTDITNTRDDLTNTDSYNSNVTTTDQVSAWNATDFADRDKQIAQRLDSDNVNQVTHRGQTSSGLAQDNKSSTGTITTTEHFHVEGDSAITDAQDVLKKEMDVRIRYDLYRIILAEFKQRFCLLVY